jgi:hypothetical protein
MHMRVKAAKAGRTVASLMFAGYSWTWARWEMECRVEALEMLLRLVLEDIRI